MKKIHEIITNRVIELIKEKGLNWTQGWSVGQPQNFVTKKTYQGFNWLWLQMQERSTPYWMTYNQVLSKKGIVRKGEKSTPVTFYNWLKPKDKKDKKMIPFLRYYNVFNLDQCDGIEIPQTRNTAPNLNATAIIEGYKDKPEISYGGVRAYYKPVADIIKLPVQSSFKSDNEFYATAFHELIHSTGHEKRLNRKSLVNNAGFGTDVYSKEELVAELGALFLCNQAGIENTLNNSAAYIQNWVKVLENDTRMIISASNQAHKAYQYILGE